MKQVSFLLGLFLLFLFPINSMADIANNTVKESKTIARLWNLQDADILSVINEVSLETGKNFVVDPRVTGKISLISSKPIKPNEVYNLFLSVLELLGYSAIPSGNVVKIVPNMESGEFATRVATAKAPGQGDEVVVRVIPLENISAAQLIPIIRPLLPQWSNISAYTPGNVLILLGRAANLERIMKVIHDVDQASNNEIDIIPLQHTSATQLTNVLTNLQNASRATGEMPQVSIAPDERNNSILLSGNKAARLRMRVLVSQLDTANVNAQGNTEVVYLRYLQAKTFAPILAKIAQNIINKDTAGSNPSSSIPVTYMGVPSNIPAKSSTAAPLNSATIQAEPNTNAIIITAPPTLMRELDSIIAKLDIRPAQVLVEAIIVEINQDDLKDFGVQWGALTNSTSTTTTSSNTTTSDGFAALGLGRVGIIPHVQFKAIVSVLQNKTGVNILSTPSVVVLDNQKATLKVGTQISETNGSYATTGNATTATPYTTTERKDVVLQLDVTPQINLGNAVRLKFKLVNDSLQNPDNPGPEPIVNKSEIDNSVIVNSSDILVLGGLISNNVRDSIDKVPLLGDIPIVGELFKHSSRKLEKKNLMVFLQPVILHNEEDVNAITNTKYQFIRNTQINWPEKLSNPGEQKLANILPLWKNKVVLPKPFES